LHPEIIYHFIRMNGSLMETTHTPPLRTGSKAEDLIELLRTMADPIRLRLVRLLESQSTNGGGAGGGLSVGELGEILKLPQSTVSRHLKTLADAHLADARRDGTSTLYTIARRDGGATTQLRQLARSHLDHDALAKADSQRLTAVLRKREPASESFFGKHAPQWDQLRAQWFGDTFHLEALLALLNPHWTIADLGTGTGAMLPLLSPHVQKIIAVDPSPAMLKAARARIKDQHLANVELRQGSVEALPIEKASVDVALLALVLAYTIDPAAALSEIKRILKPGGILLIVDLQPHNVDLFRKELNHRWMGFAQEQLHGWLKEAGFVHVRWHPLASKTGRSRESANGRGGTQIPDLFAIRAQAGGHA
jgi:ubiquinone/menaquinone biosynthesis C-methylase UbiE/DNA-binding transcriptional ArsR family regulator